MLRPLIFATSLLAASAWAEGDELESSPRAPPSVPQNPWSLDLTVHDVGLGLGNSRHIDGLRLNVTDARPFIVHGVNLTLWTPREGGGGSVTGLALGLPLTGAAELTGVGLGVGLYADRNLVGVALGVLGLGAGENLTGLTLAGIGAGAGRDVTGVTIAGLGAGAGRNLTGFTFVGLGAGAGGSVRGVSLAGLGFGAGADLLGLTIGGIGAGAGGNVRGITIGGLGVGAGEALDGLALAVGGLGAGGDAHGLLIAGVGLGVGGTLTGAAIAGLGVGAAGLDGFAAALVVGGERLRGVVVAPLWLEVTPEGHFTGFSVSAVNRIRGEPRGLVIGVVNYAEQLHGVQIGLLNWAGNNSTFKLLPLVNAHFD